MFSFITKTWNPVTGCSHHCSYCWASKLCKERLCKSMPDRYNADFSPKFNTEVLEEKFSPKDFVFVSDVGDLFCAYVPESWIRSVFSRIRAFPQTTFLLQTKNPLRYNELFIKYPGIMPLNTVYGATIESDINYPSVSKAPSQLLRLASMLVLSFVPNIRTFISIEPIMDFTDNFLMWIEWIRPWAIAIGYDNYGNHLEEPTLEKTKWLIEEAKAYTEVYIKTLRERNP